MQKPSLYLDTSVVSALWYEGADVAMLTRRLRTREWWNLERKHFALRASGFVEAELRAGVFPRQADCLKTVRRLRYLNPAHGLQRTVQTLIEHGVVPATKAGDAAHLAICTLHEIDFLLTWNYAHMANPLVQRHLEKVSTLMKLESPLMVSPETIPQARLGQTLRRR